MIRWLPAIGAVAVLLLTGCGNSDSGDSEPSVDADVAAITEALNAWPEAFNARDVAAVCDLFAPDVSVIYPDSADRDYDAFCTQMQGVLGNQERVFTYGPPDIREVLVDGDLATVQLIWTLTVADTAGAVLETVEENGLDVFRRQDDGRWKIHVSHAYPL
ncbi:YybH family protein [Antrihabitans spumae]|uniref:YybH family protein n=1 Tax=Antrihabitans spumae TaxID=3373370 RepID=A0ABW7KPN1_9NOCA